MIADRKPDRWGRHLLLLACLGIFGCRLNGCSQPQDQKTMRFSPVSPHQSSGRLPVPPRGAGHELIQVPTASRPTLLDDEPDPGFSFHGQATPRFGSAPLRVHFTLALHDPPPGLTFRWDFGDGTPPTAGMSAVHTYDEPGQYQAALMVTGPDIHETVSFLISVNAVDLDVAIDADPDIGRAPLETHFSAVVLEDVGSDVAFEWDFGDGAQGTGKSVTHTYAQPGQYIASLVVTLPAGRQGTADVLLQVDEPRDHGMPAPP